MPSMQIGLIGRRRWMAIGALLATLASFVIAGPLDLVVWLGQLGGTALAFAVNNRRYSSTVSGLAPVDVFDSWLGAAGATLLGAVVALWSANDLLALAVVAGLCIAWHNVWAFPRLTTAQAQVLVEQAVESVWRADRILVETVRRQRFHPLWPVVSFSVESDPTHSDERQRHHIALFFGRPFLLNVLFGPDAHAPKADRAFESPVVNLDTSTPVWTAPTSAHGRMGFEAKVRASA
jgi:hypothetical protein